MANTEGSFQMEIRGNNAIICPAICFEGKEGADRRGEPFFYRGGGLRGVSWGNTDVMNTDGDGLVWEGV